MQREVKDPKDVDVPDVPARGAGAGGVVWGRAAALSLLSLLSS